VFILILLRNDPRLGSTLRGLFKKIGKEGLEFREPIEEKAKAENTELNEKT